MDIHKERIATPPRPQQRGLLAKDQMTIESSRLSSTPSIPSSHSSHLVRSHHWLRWSFGLALALMFVVGVNCEPTKMPDENKAEIVQTERDAATDAPPDTTTPTDTPDVHEAPKEADAPDVSVVPDSPEEPGTPEAPDTPEISDVSDTVDTPTPVTPRLLALGKDGQLASLQLTSPWAIKASADLKRPSVSARCFGGRCLVIHPSPSDSISVVNPVDLSATSIQLASGADPRDAAFVDEHTVVVSQFGKSTLLLLNLNTGTKESIELSGLADADGLPEALRMARCERRVFVQLLRVDHQTNAPSAMGAAIAVIDIPAGGTPSVVDTDPTTPGIQPIKLSGQPKFDMPVNCASGLLYIAAPKPLMNGGGWYEQVDLKTLKASKYPIDQGAEVGGFVVVEPKLYWLITHTATGPAANSSHLNQAGGPSTTTYNTFADDKVDELALDTQQDLLFFPDNCVKTPTNQQCESGVHVFHSRTGDALPKGVIDLGFPPMELEISR